jgi:hypothetical protein
MSNEPKPQNTQDEPKIDVKPTDELADEQLDEVNGGVLIALNQPALPVQPTLPAVSPGLISSYIPPINK